MSKSPWGNIGAWAAEAERAEEEERKAAAAQPQPSFPSLKEAVSTANKQKKKTKMTLREFEMQASTYTGSASSQGLTTEEMLRLPTGPRERAPDEMQNGRLGGGFSNYGSGSSQGRRSYRHQEDDRRGGGGPSHARVSEMNQPSRADGVDNWASMKKHNVPEYNSPQSRPGGKYNSLAGGGVMGGASRADEVDNWASVKKPISQPVRQTRSPSFGSRFSRLQPDRDRWTRNEQRDALDPPRGKDEVVVKGNKPNPFGAARPREEVLAAKGLDWKKLESEVGAKQHQSVGGGSRSGSSHSSRPESPISSSRSEALPRGGEGELKQRQKVNPFGNAKPREVLLQEKGLDWKKIDLDLEHRRVDRPDTEEEKNLKEEIERLKKQLLQKDGDERTSIVDLIHQREHELEQLVRQLDDQVRYSRRHFERQGSGVGRGGAFTERPPSRPGAYEEPGAVFHDRPLSRTGSSGYPERPHSRPGRYEDSMAGSFQRPLSRGGEDPRAGFAERPSHPGPYEEPQPGVNSRPGSYEESTGGFPRRSSLTPGSYQDPRSFDYNENPRSRGTVYSWTRSNDDRRTTQGVGGRGFFGSRDTNRSGSRW